MVRGTEEEEENSKSGVTVPNNLNIETAGTKKEAAEGLESALNMEIKVVSGDEVKGEEEGDGTLRALGALELLTQYSEPSSTTLVDARNGFNKLSQLSRLWTVWHHWPAGARFTFN